MDQLAMVHHTGHDLSTDKNSDEILRSGMLAPVSGVYEVISRTGEKTGVFRSVDVNSPMPPVPEKTSYFLLVRSVDVVHTATGTAVVLDESTELFRGLLESLAKK